jgi:hypothetical protein
MMCLKQNDKQPAAIGQKRENIFKKIWGCEPDIVVRLQNRLCAATPPQSRVTASAGYSLPSGSPWGVK